MLFVRLCFAGALVFSALLPAVPAAASPPQDVQQADELVVGAYAAVNAGDVPAARKLYDEYRARWLQIEDGVKAASPDQYEAIEAAQHEVRISLTTEPLDTPRAAAALDE